jgi:hypothetical protein
LASIDPELNALPGGPRTDQVTELSKLPVPATVAENCMVVPMVAVLVGPGVTVTEVTAVVL